MPEAAPHTLRLMPMRTLPVGTRQVRSARAATDAGEDTVTLPPPPPPVEKPSLAKTTALPPRDAEIETPVLVNDLVVGRITVRIDGGTQAKTFDYVALRALLADSVSPDLLAELDALAGGRAFVPFQQTTTFKVPIRFDEDQLATTVTVGPAFSRVQAFQVRPGHRDDATDIVKPARLSGYLNMRAAMDYQEGDWDPGFRPLRVNLDGAVNVKGWVLEGQADYMSANEMQSMMKMPLWQRGNVRLVKDDVAHMLRYAAGDLSYPVSGFQSFSSMGGLSVARNFSLQPYNVFKPTGQSSILLTSASQVEIYINGNRDRVLHLPAGNYSLSDFPVVDGVNDVHMLITDATGRVEEHTLSIFTSDNLLRKGVQTFSYNLGLSSTVDNGRIRYSNRLAFSGFSRYGVTDSWTLGANLQGDGVQQMAGISSVTQGRLGNVQVDLAASHDGQYGSGTSGRVQYSYIDPRQRTFDLALSYRDPDFQPLGQRGRALERYTISARYGQKIFRDIQAAFGARIVGQRSLHGEIAKPQWAYSANFSKYINPSLSLGANIGASNSDRFSLFVSLSWVPGNSHRRGQQAVNASYDSSSDTARADWSYSGDRRERNLSAQASLVRRAGETGIDGNLDYASYRFEASAQHTTGANRTARDQVRAASAVVFALTDGGPKFAVSRPVSNSFALVYPHDDLRGHDIGINPSIAGRGIAFDAVASRFGAAVLPDMEAYYDRPITIDTRHVPAGFDVGASQVVLAPTYKSAVTFRVGSGADAYARGRITLADGKAAGLISGEVTGPGGYDKQIFTDRNGVFFVYGLARGAYHLTLAGQDKPVDFKIAVAKGDMVDLGTIALPAPKDQVIRQ